MIYYQQIPGNNSSRTSVIHSSQCLEMGIDPCDTSHKLSALTATLKITFSKPAWGEVLLRSLPVRFFLIKVILSTAPRCDSKAELLHLLAPSQPISRPKESRLSSISLSFSARKIDKVSTERESFCQHQIGCFFISAKVNKLWEGLRNELSIISLHLLRLWKAVKSSLKTSSLVAHEALPRWR